MYNLEILEKNKAVLKIDIKGDEFKKLKDEVIEKYKNSKIDGFRKGHAPLDVIEKTFSNQIKEEMLNKTIQTAYPEALKEKDVEPLGELSIEKYSLTNEEVNVEIAFDTKPEFELPKYKGLNVEVEKKEVSEEMLEQRLNRYAESQKTFENITDREDAQLNDVVNIDFEGFVDGVAFEGGKSEAFDLTLGTKTFIDNFEEQIVGHKVGETFDVNVVFPEEYHSEQLKGKPALFKVKLNSIKVAKLPEINDELAKRNGYDSLEDFKNFVKGDLESSLENEAKNQKYEKIADSLVEAVSMELPENIVNAEYEQEMATLNNQLSMQGISFEKYLDMIGKTKEDYEKEAKERAEKIVKYNLIISKIAKVENITVTKEDVQEQLKSTAAMYGMTEQQLFEELNKANMLENYQNQIAGSVFMNKMKEFLTNNN